MLNTHFFPQSHKPQGLDNALAKGWFRMGQSVFTNQFIDFDSVMYRTVWLRLCLQNYVNTKTINNLHKRNKHFTAVFTPFQVTDAHNELYETYTQAMPFNCSDSIGSLLFSLAFSDKDVFNTHQINLYDGDKLIGCSFFDFGNSSAEGISSFYDPAYAQHSLGKYLIYLQIETCIAQGITHYYPGYFVPYYPAFDYKLQIATHCLEFYNNDTNSWLPIEKYVEESIPLELKPE